MENKSKGLKILRIVLLTVFYLIIAMLLLFSIATLARKKEDQIPNLFGKGFLAVNENADSMVGDNKDSFNPGDLVLVDVLTKKQQDNLDLEDLFERNVVVTFYDRNIKQFNSHRIVEIGDDGAGNLLVRTKGDNESEIDPNYLSSDQIIAIYSGKISGLGKPIDFMQTPMGFAIVILVPMLLLLIFQGTALIKNIYKNKELQLKESLAEDKELERQRIKEELLKEIELEKSEKE